MVENRDQLLFKSFELINSLKFSYQIPKRPSFLLSGLSVKEQMHEILKDLESQLIKSFKLRLVSDVEVGIFLSGGVDSSLVTTLLQKESPKPIRTYTIGFKDEMFNEADIASKIASQIGTKHSVLYCDSQDFIKTISILPEIYDEPFGDSSAIPTYLVSKFARNEVKVVLMKS